MLVEVAVQVMAVAQVAQALQEEAATETTALVPQETALPIAAVVVEAHLLLIQPLRSIAVQAALV